MDDVCKTLETVPDDFFEACSVRGSGCRMVPVPRHLLDLQRQFLKNFSGGRGKEPKLYAMRVACPTTFGGRWFAPGFHGAPSPSIVVILSGKDYDQPVLLHEMTHWGRWIDGNDKLGRHDRAFLREVEKAYKHFSIHPSIAQEVEHHPAGFLASKGACLGQKRGR